MFGVKGSPSINTFGCEHYVFITPQPDIAKTARIFSGGQFVTNVQGIFTGKIFLGNIPQALFCRFCGLEFFAEAIMCLFKDISQFTYKSGRWLTQ
jgi:hypothetical protein